MTVGREASRRGFFASFFSGARFFLLSLFFALLLLGLTPSPAHSPQPGTTVDSGSTGSAVSFLFSFLNSLWALASAKARLTSFLWLMPSNPSSPD
eukprot:CAMPEP_0182474182 /NCGR_PEP_ID=MMETSP1319-20130603/25222_1 /TAXON_ID=172717 /ORGANISM="Bolidomonas pacifica, Strain RCC208" /LENGTH=94 /DNA_ID=CAMNT_0024675051 /DNA_START=197 /DNA_END=478 /DNA_ORIENTATION=+